MANPLLNFTEEELILTIDLANMGYESTQLFLGKCFRDGVYGLEVDYKKSAYWLSKAADQGNITACYILGTFFRDGLGVKIDYW